MIKKMLLGSLLLSFGFGANAELIEADWKSSGDNLAVYDTRTGIKWLDLSVTRNMSILQVNELLETEYKGYMLATREQTAELIKSMFPEVSSALSNNMNGYYNINHISSANSRIYEIRDLFGGNKNGFPNAMGLLYNDQESGYDVLRAGPYISSTSSKYIAFNANHSSSLTSAYHGVWLVDKGGFSLNIDDNNMVSQINYKVENDINKSVPIGSTGALLIGMLGFAGFRRKINRQVK